VRSYANSYEAGQLLTFATVKVLYSFDDQNKTNCLARLPNPQNIPTVDLDEGTQIGVMELNKCIQAIVAARQVVE